MNTTTEGLTKEEMLTRYKQAVERAIPHLAVKNGVVNIDSIWVATSIPYDLLQEILAREDLILPENVERISIRSRVHIGKQSEKPRKTKSRRRKVRD